jgi:hypothetical protein
MNFKQSPATKVNNNNSVKKLVTLFGIIVCFATFRSALAQQKPGSVTKSSPAPAAASRSPGTKRPSNSTKPASGTSQKADSSQDLFGDDSKDRPKGPTEITATQEAQFDTKTRVGVFIGNVKVVDPQFTMTSDRLTVHLNKDQEGGGLNDAEANGNVIIVTCHVDWESGKGFVRGKRWLDYVDRLAAGNTRCQHAHSDCARSENGTLQGWTDANVWQYKDVD